MTDQISTKKWHELQFICEVEIFSKNIKRRIEIIEAQKPVVTGAKREIFSYEQAYLQEAHKNLSSAITLMKEVPIVD